MIPTREEALALLREYNQEEWHVRHALAVEAALRRFAADYAPGEEDFWGVVGLLHDIDFEQYPEQHCVKAIELLGARGIDERVIHAVASHGWGLVPVEARPEHPMEKALYAVDELTGIIAACVALRPSKSILDLELSSVKKKFKQPSFAAGCSRKVIGDGADMLGLPLDDLIVKTLEGMRAAADELGMRGDL